MSNLSNALNFGRATLSVGSDPLLRTQALLDRIRGVGEWEIQEATFIPGSGIKGTQAGNKLVTDLISNAKEALDSSAVKFHVFQDSGGIFGGGFGTSKGYKAGLSSATDQGGRRKAIYKFPYLDGQTTDDLGRDGYTYTFEAIFHGKNYRQGFDKLRKAFEGGQPGDLIHPVIGLVRVVPHRWTFTYQSDTRQAVLVRLEFLEHAFDLGATISGQNGTGLLDTFKDAVGTALALTKGIENAINFVAGLENLAQSFKNSLTNNLEDAQASYRTLVLRMNKSFNGSGDSDIPGAVSVEEGGTTTTTGQEASTVFPSASSPNDPFRGLIPSETEVVATLDPNQAQAEANSYRNKIDEIIVQIAAGNAELSLYQQILDLKLTAIAAQDLVEKAIRSSRPKTFDYTVPRLMSIREVAFLNGLSPDSAIEIDQLNPFLDSVNNIPKDTVLKVPLV